MAFDGICRYIEARLAEKIGAPRAELRKQRKLHFEEGPDYKKIGGEILLSERCVFGLAKLNAVDPPPPDLLTYCLAPISKNGPVTMIVERRCPNPKMVLARDENDELHLVDVSKNATFATFDEIEVVPHDTQPLIWRLVSPVPRDLRRPIRS